MIIGIETEKIITHKFHIEIGQSELRELVDELVNRCQAYHACEIGPGNFRTVTFPGRTLHLLGTLERVLKDASK